MNGVKPNVVYIFSDQHRAEAVGYENHPDVKTPNMDQLAQQALRFTTAVSCMPVCAPYRASLMTGQYPLTHGVFVNDVQLSNTAVSLGQAFQAGGYHTAYIGKWHLDGPNRSAFIPVERRQGFDHWCVLNCTHDYNTSNYYDNEDQFKQWEGYDAFAQTKEAQRYISQYKDDKPFILVLSWGPPHNPYETAPKAYRDMYDPQQLTLRGNIPHADEEKAREELAGYYSHITALDDCLGSLMETITEKGILNDTIVIYTSDHGDMLYSHGEIRKQRPWDESIRVPFLLHYPREFGNKAKEISIPFNTPDIMPTLLGLCGLTIPETVEGTNFTPHLLGEETLHIEEALIMCPHPFGEYKRIQNGREYRGIRTERYTYVKDLKGPWLLYDNKVDPLQLHNLVDLHEYEQLQKDLDLRLMSLLKQRDDDFLPGEAYIDRWGYEVDQNGTVPFVL
ncbi:sulfatase [Paenibacillus sp. YYML68]|uniref:sulfatase family protein n=1 Tax=Paenibacillus sp. YYML68 TaxID=2909250 RepID=UPI0024916DC7|nr:sulfatase [Paenibacillus sp. YYML68]